MLLVIFFSAISSEYLTQSNLILMTKHVAINAILAIGVTFVILTGGIDLSVGSIAGLASMIAGGLLFKGLAVPGGTLFFSVAVVILIGILVGAAVGAVNGLLITRFRVAPFIATLGMLYVARGVSAAAQRRRHLPGPGRHRRRAATRASTSSAWTACSASRWPSGSWSWSRSPRSS